MIRMRVVRKVLGTAAIAVALPTGASAQEAMECTDETTEIAVESVVTFDSVTFNWSPRCGVAVLLVELQGAGSDMWGLMAPMELWSNPSQANRIMPGLSYGVAPEGVTVRERPGMLEVGKSYELVLWRLLPAGSAAVCTMRRDDACLVAVHHFIR